MRKKPRNAGVVKGAGSKRYCCFPTQALTELKTVLYTPKQTKLICNYLTILMRLAFSKNDILNQIWGMLEMLR